VSASRTSAAGIGLAVVLACLAGPAGAKDASVRDTTDDDTYCAGSKATGEHIAISIVRWPNGDIWGQTARMRIVAP
jgi:hypothetical protein